MSKIPNTKQKPPPRNTQKRERVPFQSCECVSNDDLNPWLTYWKKKKKNSDQFPSSCLHLCAHHRSGIQNWIPSDQWAFVGILFERASDSITPSFAVWARCTGPGAGVKAQLSHTSLLVCFISSAVWYQQHEMQPFLSAFHEFVSFIHFFPCCRREHMLLATCVNEPLMPLLN